MSSAPTGPSTPSQPSRGDLGSYARYLKGMDASMRQKIALTAAHLFGTGRVADMGMGSGAGSHALAALYEGLEVVGVDLDPTMVELARTTHVLPNLSFEVGDIGRPVFAEGSLDGIFDSSVLHHVTSFGGYDHEAAARALAVQARQLREGGVLVVRDFLDPGPGECLLDVRDDDGDEGDDPATASSAALLERFARTFRSLHADPGFAMARRGSPAPGWRRFRLSLRHAVEFVLRKDYRADWVAEAKEEYTYFHRARFEQVFASLGLRVLASTPLRNPWIVRHRFVGKIALRTLEGEERDVPATNYVIVGEKVAPGEGVRFADLGEAPRTGFLALDAYRDVRSGKLWDLARRPNVTVDVVPWFRTERGVFVVARTSYPRPIPRSALASPPLGDAPSPEWMAEPLHALLDDKPIGQTVEETLARVAGIDADRIQGFAPGTTYYPSPGGLQEEVRSIFVEIEPLARVEARPGGSPFASSGTLAAIDAQQLLRAGQVDALPDARLELNVRALLARLGLPWGPWIGDELVVPEGGDPTPTALADLLARPARRVFRHAPGESAGFLAVSARRFAERDAADRTVSEATLEVVVPRELGTLTVAVAAIRRSGDRIFMAVDDDDLPAAQCFAGNSNVLVAPAWRLPRSVASLGAMRAFVGERFAAEHALAVSDTMELGGRYLPSPGVTPEVVYPLLALVSPTGAPARALAWVPLEDLVAGQASIPHGHLRILALRAAHALGLHA
jgi:SAM-dependent methyltransferase